MKSARVNTGLRGPGCGRPLIWALALPVALTLLAWSGQPPRAGMGGWSIAITTAAAVEAGPQAAAGPQDPRVAQGWHPGGELPVRVEVRLAHPVVAGDAVQQSFVWVGLIGEGDESAGPGFGRGEVPAGNRLPVNLALVLDRSATMQGERLRQACQAVGRVLDWMQPDDVLAIVVYDSNVQVLLPASRQVDQVRVRQLLDELQARGHSNLFGGITRGAAEVRKFASGDRVSRVLLLSDGKATIGPGTPKALGELGASLHKEGISVSTIGLGLDYNEDLMVELAARSHGNHHFVEQPEDLAEAFEAELRQLDTVAATDVVLLLEFAPGVTPVRSLGRPVEITGNQVTARFGQVSWQQETALLLEVSIDPAEVDESAPVVTAKVAPVTVAWGMPQRSAVGGYQNMARPRSQAPPPPQLTGLVEGTDSPGDDVFGLAPEAAAGGAGEMVLRAMAAAAPAAPAPAPATALAEPLPPLAPGVVAGQDELAPGANGGTEPTRRLGAGAMESATLGTAVAAADALQQAAGSLADEGRMDQGIASGLTVEQEAAPEAAMPAEETAAVGRAEAVPRPEIEPISGPERAEAARSGRSIQLDEADHLILAEPMAEGQGQLREVGRGAFADDPEPLTRIDAATAMAADRPEVGDAEPPEPMAVRAMGPDEARDERRRAGVDLVDGAEPVQPTAETAAAPMPELAMDADAELTEAPDRVALGVPAVPGEALAEAGESLMDAEAAEMVLADDGGAGGAVAADLEDRSGEFTAAAEPDASRRATPQARFRGQGQAVPATEDAPRLRFSADPGEVELNTDTSVLAAAMEQQARRQSELAIELRDAGEIERAEELLRLNTQELEDLSQRYDDPGLQQQAMFNRRDADSVGKTGAEWERQRKVMRARNMLVEQYGSLPQLGGQPDAAAGAGDAALAEDEVDEAAADQHDEAQSRSDGQPGS